MIPTRERLQLRPVARKPEVIDLSGGSARAVDFGVAGIGQTTVTFNGGTVIGFSGIVEAAAVTVSCGGTEAAPHVVVVQGEIDPLSATILATSIPESSFTGHDATTWRRPLARVYLVNGSVVVSRIKWQGCIDLKAWVGP